MTDFIENNYNTPISEIPTEKTLITSYGKIIKRTTGMGTNNIVHTLTLRDGTKKSVRISKNPFFDISPTGMSRFSEFLRSDSDDETIEEINQTRTNWIEAAADNLAPKLFFYGYIKKVHSDGWSELYPAIVTVGYDTDLNSYYNDPQYQGYRDKMLGVLTDTDKEIAKQVIYILNKSLSHNLKVICFDIKPANCVINTFTDGRKPDVKLIDWDADLCKNYSVELSKRSNPKLPLISILSKMIMAAHFYKWCKWNIFSDYFLNDINAEYGGEYGTPVLEILKDSLKHLFCQLDKSAYKVMASHYFFMGQTKTCEEMFDKIFEWCTKCVGRIAR